MTHAWSINGGMARKSRKVPFLLLCLLKLSSFAVHGSANDMQTTNVMETTEVPESTQDVATTTNAATATNVGTTATDAGATATDAGITTTDTFSIKFSTYDFLSTVPDCEFEDCSMEYVPVCGSDGQVYTNQCILNNAACVNPNLSFAHEGECSPDEAARNFNTFLGADICADVDCDSRGPGAIECNNNGECECISTGFILQSTNGPCINIDECSEGLHACDPLSTRCTDTTGSYGCECLPGFEVETGSPTSCTRTTGFDKCANIICDTSGPGAIECNSNGECECVLPGFTLESTNGPCINIDECSQGLHACDTLSTRCTDTIGSYDCHCLPGFDVDPRSTTSCTRYHPCEPNPCVLGSSNNIVCTAGVCSCPAGFTLHNKTGPCVDDLCNPNPCLPGSSNNIICNAGVCSCPSGFTLQDQNGPCMDEEKSGSLVVLMVLALLVVLASISCSCCIFILLKNAYLKKNTSVYKYTPAPTYAVSGRRARHTLTSTPQRGKLPLLIHDETDVESLVDQRRMEDVERVFHHATGLNSRWSSRGNRASAVSVGASLPNSLESMIASNQEFNIPYTADGTQNV